MRYICELCQCDFNTSVSASVCICCGSMRIHLMGEGEKTLRELRHEWYSKTVNRHDPGSIQV